ncbi:lipoxygenase 3 chloroplastic-like [Tripterygium wilfordii]|uniref:Lipoxygenase 3 chloroplastic-like n=1 Tax=Tripterygium wilfordii TaxID=458696 RepID=A0A7J7C4P2_TRIWF|nr:lipoxygenase 3 chloroplastic-like [Tripterygium wilfordii]
MSFNTSQFLIPNFRSFLFWEYFSASFRGLAKPEPTQSHALRLLIEDYPYANDLIWSSIERSVKTNVNYYYPEAGSVQCDIELQAWYKEYINVGHDDLNHANWWPKLSSQLQWSRLHTLLLFGLYQHNTQH